VADVAQDEADEHEEEADQREGGGRADHLWRERSKVRTGQSFPHSVRNGLSWVERLQPSYLLTTLCPSPLLVIVGCPVLYPSAWQGFPSLLMS